MLVPLSGFHQSDIAFLDQIQQGQAASGVMFGHIHNQAKVAAHQLVFGRFEGDARGFQLRQGRLQFPADRDGNSAAGGGVQLKFFQCAFRLIEHGGRQTAQAAHCFECFKALGRAVGSFQAAAGFDRLLKGLSDLACAEIKLFRQGNLFIPFEQRAFAERTEVERFQEKGRRG